MEMPKPTDADRAKFVSLVPDDSRVEVKPMFGNLGAFVNGNMFMGLFGSAIGVKLTRRYGAGAMSRHRWCQGSGVATGKRYGRALMPSLGG